MLQRILAWHVLLGSSLCVTPVAAQQDAPAHAAIRGVVIAAADGAPLADVLLCINPLERVGDGTVPAAHCFRSVVSDALGRYHSERLPPGSYVLDAVRLGYRPQRVLVEARGAGSVAVWLALAAEPVLLETLVLRARSATRAAHANGIPATPAPRAPLDVGDVYYLNNTGPTATVGGEPDVLRALHRLPGVTTRSDYTAELWTRGAPWYQTRVRFDGVPLYQPLHGLGAFSGFASAAIGSLVFRPGPGSAAGEGGAAGTVELRSRRAQGSGGINTRMDLSLVGATLSLDQRIAEGAVGWAATARRTHIDWLSRLASRAARTPRLDVPLAFWDVAAAADARIGEGATLSFSTLLQRDALEGSDSAQAHWGNTAAQLTLHTRRTRHTLGVSSHDNAVPRRLTLDGTWLPYAHGEATHSAIGYVGLSGDMTGASGWSAGYAAMLQRTSYSGPAVYPVPRPTSTVAAAGGAPAADGGEREREEARLPVLAAWADYSWPLPVRLSTGLRVETGPAVHGGGSVRWSPHVAATYPLAPAVTAHAAAGRTWQYVHSVVPAGVHVASLSSGHRWLLAGATVPALRADAASLGVVVEPTSLLKARVTAFARSTAGMVLPDPRPGPLLLRAERVAGVNRAAGVETAFALATSQITADVGYTFTSSHVRAAGLRYAASAEVPHALDVAVRLRTHERLDIAAAFTHTSGIPYTPVFGNAGACGGTSCDDAQPVPWAGEPNAARAPPYASLDLLLDWTLPLQRVDARVYLQLRNALGHDNATVYTGVAHCGVRCPAGVQVQDRLERGLPRLPVFGVHVRF